MTKKKKLTTKDNKKKVRRKKQQRNQKINWSQIAQSIIPAELSDKQKWGGGIALFLLAFLIYWPSINGGFIWDDVPFIVQNQLLQPGSSLGSIWFDLSAYKMAYYPMTYSSLWMNYQLGGLEDTFSYHYINILLHATNALILWGLLRKLSIPGAFFAALIFLVHPINVESVAWIIERKNVLSGLFFLLSIWTWLDFSQKGDWKKYAISLLLFTIGMMSKSSVFTLPFVLALLIFWKSAKEHYKRDLISLIPMLIIGVVLVNITMQMDAKNTVDVDYGVSFADAIIISGKALWFYFGKLILPIDTMPIYPKWAIDPGQASQFLPAFAYLLLLLTLWLLRNRISVAPLVAFLFFGLTHGPTLGFIEFSYMGHSYIADHFQYFPMMGMIAALVAFVAIALKYFLKEKSRMVSWGIAALFVGIFAVQSFLGNYHYLDQVSFWKHSSDMNPIHTNLSALGDAYLRKSEDYKKQASTALGNGEKQELMKLADEYKALANQYVELGLNKNESSRGYFRKGELFLQDSDFASALEEFKKAIIANRTSKVATMEESAMYMAGYCSFNLNDYETAIQYFKDALSYNPDLIEANYLLGKTLNRNGQHEEAIGYLEKTLSLNPGYLDTQSILQRAKNSTSN